ncbi:MAG: hypothetical protein DMG72_10085 [Acidobacteria bacterium]|nr:MAG: hypothetical protein DMG72_10085 [Acidobacteriota bacterium]
MALNLFAAGNRCTVRSHQIFRQLGLEVFSRLQAARVKLVFQPDQESSSLGNGIGIRNRSDC